MPRDCVTETPNNIPIPVGQIIETRRVFGSHRISYEAEIETSDIWQGLEFCASAFRRSGLTALSVRCTRSGVISCKLADTGSADLAHLTDLVGGQGVVSIMSWVTHINARSSAVMATTGR